LEINRRPVLAFSSSSLRTAQARVKEPWFQAELQQMRSGGRTMLHPDDECVVRTARPEEASEVRLQHELDKVRGEDIKYCFAFLLPIDAPPH
jgi:hypothetical protein